MNVDGLLRRKLLEQMYDKMSDDEKRLFIYMSIDNKSHDEILQAINELKQKADKNHHSFALDLAANIAGNGVWDAFVWFGSKLIRKL